MPKWILFEECLRRKLIREGDTISIPSELFLEREKEVILTPKETGGNESQVFKWENLNWIFRYDEQRMPAFFGSATSKKMCLKGETGYSKGIQAQNKICELYSNSKIWDARTITFEEGENLRTEYGYRNIWLGTNDFHIAANQSFTIYGMYYIDKDGFVQIAPLYQKPCSYDFYKVLSIGPVLSIKPFKLYVDKESKKENGKWRVIQK